jgi:rRNA maturation endonuclease Nob1
MDNSLILSTIGWNLRCTNDKCGGFFMSNSKEPDVICQRCGSKLEVNERIIFKNEEDK